MTFISICSINLDYINIQYITIHDEKSNIFEFDRWFVRKWAAFYKHYAEYKSLCLRSIIPFSVLIIGNSMIIYKIHKSNVYRQDMTQTANQSTDLWSWPPNRSTTICFTCVMWSLLGHWINSPIPHHLHTKLFPRLKLIRGSTVENDYLEKYLVHVLRTNAFITQ